MKSSSTVYHWHSQFNVYVLKNKDVLLLSSGQQLLLPQSQFPYVDEINGKNSVDDILSIKSNLDERTSLFLYQINKLLELNLIEVASNTKYVKPLFSGSPNVVELLQDGPSIQNVSFSLLTEAKEGQSQQYESWLVQLLESVDNLNSELQILIVDDFLDGRVASLVKKNNFILMKLTGGIFSVSPIFKVNELALFEALQAQLLENQPVRKMLELCFPNGSHSFPFDPNEIDLENAFFVIQELFQKQINDFVSNQPKNIRLYRSQTSQYESHIVNPLLDNDVDFSVQIESPLLLNSCISEFNADGGSRSVSAKNTVERLMPLVSPITGVINHIEVIGDNPLSPIKIYRTGFFKTTNKSEISEFDRNSFVQICLGKGVSHEQSKASALSEAIERYAALYNFDVNLFNCKLSDFIKQGQRAYGFQDLIPYSQAQYANFNDNEHPDSDLKQAAIPYKDEGVHWLPTWSLTEGERVYVPLTQCFSNIPFSDDIFGRWHSNGCAAGNTVEEAILQALFELIERDATAIWWYNKLTPPIFDVVRINADNLAKLDKCLSPNDDFGHNYWVLDLTTDLGVPVMGAIGRDKKTGGLVMGFGCHLIPEMAAQRALTELCQLIPIRNQNAAPFDFDAIEEGDYLIGSNSKKSNSYALQSSADIKDDISTIVAQLKLKGMEVLALNYSRAHIPLSTAKVFVPGLCHIWPQLANERLYQAPLNMGCLKVANTEQSINQQALYI